MTKELYFVVPPDPKHAKWAVYKKTRRGNLFRINQTFTSRHLAIATAIGLLSQFPDCKFSVQGRTNHEDFPAFYR